MEAIESHYKEIRVLIVLVLSIVLLSTVYLFGIVTSHLEDIDQARHENRRRIELLERENDRLMGTLRGQAATNWTRKDMQLYCTMYANMNPGVKCPDVNLIPREVFEAITPLPPVDNKPTP